MEYLLVIWRNSNPAMPKILYHEIGEDRYETRKIEVFDGGKIGYAYGEVEYCESNTFAPTMLSDQPYPNLNEMKNESDSWSIQISKNEFEDAWKKFGPKTEG